MCFNAWFKFSEHFISIIRVNLGLKRSFLFSVGRNNFIDDNKALQCDCCKAMEVGMC